VCTHCRVSSTTNSNTNNQTTTNPNQHQRPPKSLQGPCTEEGGTEWLRGHINCELGQLSACTGETTVTTTTITVTATPRATGSNGNNSISFCMKQQVPATAADSQAVTKSLKFFVRH